MPTMSSLCPVNVVPEHGRDTDGVLVDVRRRRRPGRSCTSPAAAARSAARRRSSGRTSPTPRARRRRTPGSGSTSARRRPRGACASSTSATGAPSMIASDDPWVRAPVVSPGAWKRSASIRMQRCSISAVRGYSAWSMKLRCRFVGDDPLGLRLHPRRHEGRQVPGRITLERQVLADQPHRVRGGHARLRELPGRHLLGDESVAEQRSVARRGWCGHGFSFVRSGAPISAPLPGPRLTPSGWSGGSQSRSLRLRVSRKPVATYPKRSPIRAPTAPTKSAVPWSASPRSDHST